MKNSYFDLIDQTFYFPQDGFDLEDSYLNFNDIPLKHLIDTYGTPLRISFLPKIGTQIKKARNIFNRAIKSLGYKGKYYYCYCTKSSHFKYVLDEVLEHKVHLETSSAFDIDLIRLLYAQKQIDKQLIIICNGFKPTHYVEKIAQLIQDGFVNTIPVCDNFDELKQYQQLLDQPFEFGLRIATDEEPNFEFYTSRLGIRNAAIVDLFHRHVMCASS